MTVGIEQHVVQLQIAIDNFVFVQKEQGNRNFHRIETKNESKWENFKEETLARTNSHGHRLLEASVLLHVIHEIAALAVLHDEEESVHGLEA